MEHLLRWISHLFPGAEQVGRHLLATCYVGYSKPTFLAPRYCRETGKCRTASNIANSEFSSTCKSRWNRWKQL